MPPSPTVSLPCCESASFGTRATKSCRADVCRLGLLGLLSEELVDSVNRLAARVWLPSGCDAVPSQLINGTQSRSGGEKTSVEVGDVSMYEVGRNARQLMVVPKGPTPKTLHLSTPCQRLDGIDRPRVEEVIEGRGLFVVNKLKS